MGCTDFAGGMCGDNWTQHKHLPGLQEK